MSNYNVIMTHSARDDLNGISLYIAKELKEPAAAKKLIGKIREAVLNLKEMPTRHSVVSDKNLAIKGIRKIVVDNYLVFYVIFEEEKAVAIVRILYGRRNWANLL